LAQRRRGIARGDFVVIKQVVGGAGQRGVCDWNLAVADYAATGRPGGAA
jgi:hypothetical protein